MPQSAPGWTLVQAAPTTSEAPGWTPVSATAPAATSGIDVAAVLGKVLLPYGDPETQQSVGNGAVGMLKGLGHTATTLGSLVHKIPGFREGLDALYGVPGLSQAAFTEAEQATRPQGTAQQIGYLGEQGAEFLLPSGPAERGAVYLAGKAAPYLARAPQIAEATPAIVKAAAKVLPRAATEAAASAGTAVAQGADPTSAAVMGAVAPYVGSAVGAGVRTVAGPLARGLYRNLNPVAAEAVAFGQRMGIPIDAATATGSDVLALLQKKAASTVAGGRVAEPVVRAQREALETVGEQLAGAANLDSVTGLPGAAVTPLQAGEATQQAVRDVVHAKNVQATTAYDRLRNLAQQFQETVTTRAPEAAPPGASTRFTFKRNPTPDEVFEAAYQDAQASGYRGSKQALRTRFDQSLSSGMTALEEQAQTQADYGPEALLKSIRELGGLRPFTKDLATGTKLRGDFESIVESFGAKSGWGQKGGASPFRTQGLGLDDMTEQLRQDPRWRTVIHDENDLVDVLDEIGRAGPTPATPHPTIEEALSISDARPGAKWWVPRTEEVQALPVDLRTVKPQLQPIYDRLARERELAPAMMVGGKAEAFNALDQIMRAPDYAPLTDVDAVLSELKSFARADNPDLRTVGQGAVAQAVKSLDAQVRATATKAGPDVVQALEAGRKATIEKYGAAKVLGRLEGQAGQIEGVGAYKRLVAPGDSAFRQLQQVVTQAPDAAPQIARAFLGDLIGQATQAGTFDLARAPAMEKTWRMMGPQTKTLLFKDPAYIADLDNYFRLAKKIAENPNPSGTERMRSVVEFATNLIGYPAAKLLYSPRGVKLLTEGLRLPAGSAVAKTVWANRLRQVASQLPGAPDQP